MPSVISNNVQKKRKNCYASAPTLDLTLITNGEEANTLLDGQGNLIKAGIEAPTVAPTISDNSAGNLTEDKWITYRYVYAASSKYPFVENTTAAGGSVAPRSNPSPRSSAFQIAGGAPTGNRKLNVTIPKSTRSDIDEIWVYRTADFDTQVLAETAGDAGQMFYLGSIENDRVAGTVIYVDNSAIAGGEQLEFDNFTAPTTALCVYFDPYFYAIGNFPLAIEVTLGATAIITIVDSTLKWFPGRDKFFIKLVGITSGGFDDFGTFYFQYLTSTTAQLTTDQEGDDVAVIPYTGVTRATIYSYATTLYRSKRRNPFGWGEVVTIGTSIVSRTWAFKIGGGYATSMATIPNNPLLKIDLINPSKCYLLNLKIQEQATFKGSLRTISEAYISTIQSAQFATITSRNQPVLWGIDLKQQCIVECDGNSQVPIGNEVFLSLQDSAQHEDEVLYYHGVYDPFTECSFLWVKIGDGPNITHCIYQHAPSGQWGTMLDFDLSASVAIEDPVTNETLILGGDTAGNFGQILNRFKFTNWLSGNTQMTAPMVETSYKAIEYVIEKTLSVSSDDHLSFFVFYSADAANTLTSIFCYIDVGNTGAPPPSESNNYDLVLKIVSTLGDNVNVFAASFQSAVSLNGSVDSIVNCIISVFNPEEITLTSKYDSSETAPAFDPQNSNLSDVVSDSYIPGGKSVLIEGSLAFQSVIGGWIFVETGDRGKSGFWGRIIYRDNLLLYLDTVYGDFVEVFADSQANLQVFSGLIECRFFKSFDLQKMDENKSIKEVWLAAQNALEFSSGEFPRYPQKLMWLFHKQLSETPDVLVIPNQDKDVSGASPIDAFFVSLKDVPSNPFKTFGMSVVQRGSEDFTIFNMSLKGNG